MSPHSSPKRRASWRTSAASRRRKSRKLRPKTFWNSVRSCEQGLVAPASAAATTAAPVSTAPAAATTAAGRPPRPPPPPNPPPAGLGRASLTFIARPFISAPLSCEIAVSASRWSVISTNANPRGWPVSRSVTMLTRSTFPYCAKAACSSSWVVWKLRFPTKMFILGSCSFAIQTVFVRLRWTPGQRHSTVYH